MTKYVVVDLETTGLHPQSGDQVISLGAIEVEGLTVKPAMDILIRPKRTMKYVVKGTGPVDVHQITRGELKSAATFRYWAPMLHSLLRDSVFVAHNVNFDAEFLNTEFKRIGLRPVISDRLCTGRMAAKLLNDPRGYVKLEKACEALNIPLENHHVAIEDAQASASILLKWLQAQKESSK